jgi:hypothetical protein
MTVLAIVASASSPTKTATAVCHQRQRRGRRVGGSAAGGPPGGGNAGGDGESTCSSSSKAQLPARTADENSSAPIRDRALLVRRELAVSIVHQSATYRPVPSTRPLWGRWAALVAGTAVGIGLLAAGLLGAVLVLMSNLAG